MRWLRNYGDRGDYHHQEVGFNSRLDELHAAILKAKLPHLDRWNDVRRALHARYRKGLAAAPLAWNEEADGFLHVRHLCVARHPERDRLRAFLSSRGIQSKVHYPVPVHRQPAYRFLGYREGEFPIAEKLASSVMSLPLYPEMTHGAQDSVIEAIREWLRTNG